MTSVGAKFVGGPNDGEERMLHVGPDGLPPAVVTFISTGLSAVDIWSRPGAPVEHIQHHYRREPSEDDLSGGWIYRYAEPHTAKKET